MHYTNSQLFVCSCHNLSQVPKLFLQNPQKVDGII